VSLLNLDEITQVHTSIKHMFQHLKFPDLPLAGRIKSFLPAWKMLTQDKKMLSIVKGYQIPFFFRPYTKGVTLSRENKPKKGTSSRCGGAGDVAEGCHYQSRACTREFLSNVFLVPKKDGGFRPVINLKALNHFVPYEHFKMEGLHCLKDILQP